MTCKLCAPFVGKGVRNLARGDMTVKFVASEPKCAFNEKGEFVNDNWDCQTLNVFRNDSKCTTTVFSEDQTLLVVALEGDFIVLGFYKQRGRVETAVVIYGPSSHPLTLREAEHAVEHGILPEQP